MPGWRQPRGDGAVIPVEALTSRQAMAGSRAVWRARHDVAAALLGSPALRAAARVGGYDVWDLIAPELQGIATLQFPWSARAMDEAGAAMDLRTPAAGPDLRRSRRLGPRDHARGAAPRHPAAPASSTASSIGAG